MQIIEKVFKNKFLSGQSLGLGRSLEKSNALLLLRKKIFPLSTSSSPG
jgi:hypothetical protein